MENTELVELTRRLLDLKREKKEYCKDANESIKETEAAIKKLVKEKGGMIMATKVKKQSNIISGKNAKIMPSVPNGLSGENIYVSRLIRKRKHVLLFQLNDNNLTSKVGVA